MYRPIAVLLSDVVTSVFGIVFSTFGDIVTVDVPDSDIAIETIIQL